MNPNGTETYSGQHMYKRTKVREGHNCAVLVAVLSLLSVSQTVDASPTLGVVKCNTRNQNPSDRCHFSQYCGQLVIRVDPEGEWTGNFCLCCCPLTANAIGSRNGSGCNWNFTWNSITNKCDNTSGCPVQSSTATTASTATPTTATASSPSPTSVSTFTSTGTTPTSGDVDDESALFLAVPVGITGLLLLGVLVLFIILYRCKGVGCRVQENEANEPKKVERCLSISMPSPTDEIILQETFRTLCPSPLPPIDEETPVIGNDGNRLRRTSRTSLPSSCPSALEAVCNSTENWNMFCKFCGSLDIGKLPDMDWRNVAQDLGYQIRDIDWINTNQNGRSKSRVCIQDFLGRTPLNKSDEAFQILHRSVSCTKNISALEELECVRVRCRIGIVTVKELTLHRKNFRLTLVDPTIDPSLCTPV